ncbi:MAG: hypothetical protein QF570_03260 [Myxococcota bacterium]|jgi:hypothetical protein|nr:hypothetical protein [Myxococcota bacterium]
MTSRAFPNLRSIVVAVLVAFQLLGVPGAAFAQDAEAASVEEVEYEMDAYEIGATALDVTLLRPLGALTMLGGMVFFVASVPFVAPSDRIATSWDIFVYSSYDYAVLRPLGELF